MPALDKNINRMVGRAMHRYELLHEGDHIVVGLSGGKDSLSLLYVLSEWKKKTPFVYNLSAVHIDLGFGGEDPAPLGEFCRSLSIPLRIEKTRIGIVAHSSENRENPCFLCSRLRKKRIFEIAHELGANKVALGHNKDDLIETLLLNIFYSGAISTMVPRQPFFGGLLTVIRPMVMVEAKYLQAFAKRMSFPELKSACPSAENSRRKEIRVLLENLYKTNEKVKGNIFHALSNVRTGYLL